MYSKVRLSYRLDFLISVLTTVVATAASVAVIFLIFARMPRVAGWSFLEILFLYGFSLLPMSLFNMLSINLYFFSDSYTARPRAADENLLAVVVHICPLQTEALGNAKPRSRDEECESALRLRHCHENPEALFRCDDLRLVFRLSLHPDKLHGVGFPGARNQPIGLPVLKDQVHHTADLVHRGVLQVLHPLAGLQPLHDLERLNFQRGTISPARNQAVVQDLKVAFYGGVRLLVVRFGKLA